MPPSPHLSSGLDLIRANRLREARDLYAELARLHPHDPQAWFFLGAIHGQMGALDRAVYCCRRAVDLRPDNADAHFNLAQAYMHLNQLDRALAAYRDVVRLRPENAEAHANIAMILKDQGRLPESIASLRRALALKPDYANVHSNLLFFLHYMEESPDILFAEHLAWAKAHVAAITVTSDYDNPPDPSRRLRIGYVSPDFRAHSVVYFAYALLAYHDPAAVDVLVYSNVAKPDEDTARVRALGHIWRDIHGVPDDDVAARIRNDNVDILVDLAGHTAGNRLAVFARKPAPVQVTYLGYPDTTGLATMNHRLADGISDPPGHAESWHTEKLARLPDGFLCYTPPLDAPEVGPPPAARVDYVTFGSFNNLAKITPAVAEIWARLLGSVPGSRLVLKNKSFADIETRDRWREQFERLGVGPARLAFNACTSAIGEHLGMYGAIDVALDTFPYNGTTTTCEALWMGVPVVTLAGRTHASRVGMSLLSQIGLPELIATGHDDYVNIAVALARDARHRADLRRQLRPRLAASSLCDGPAFARKVENAYRAMWRAWCVGRTAGN